MSSNTIDTTIFDSESIRAIQTDELSAIESLSLNELSTRIAMYQRTSRELALRMQKASEILHKRLSAKTSDELEGMIESVPQAETIVHGRKGFGQVKKLNAEQKIQARAKAMAKSNPLLQQMLDELKKKG